MKEITISTQKELDALPASFPEFTYIYIKNTKCTVYVKVARENSSVEARGNSSVEVWGNVGVHCHSENANIVLFMFAACWAIAKGKIKKKSATASIIKPKVLSGTDGWLDSQGVKKNRRKVILFKRVSFDFKTQENTPNETVWAIGKTITHSKWEPEKSECGEGKFHACSTGYFCDEFRSTKGDKYIAISISVQDLFAWKNAQYPHKIAFRKGTVMYECNKHGKKL